jgi:raffinose/stachyose/melibiose transport system permease protein
MTTRRWMHLTEHAKRYSFRGVLYAACLAYSLIVAAPILWLILLSLSTNREISARGMRLPESFHFEHYLDVWTGGNYRIYFTNSLVVVTVALGGIVLIGAMGAYAFARFRFPLRESIYMVVFSSIIIPQQMLLIPLFLMFTAYHLENTRVGLILVYVAVSLPLTVYILRNFFEQIPEDLADAARADGCSEWQVFWDIMFPIASPAISTVIVFHFIFLWNEFLLANIFIREETRRTVQLGLMQYFGLYYLDYAHLAAASLLTALPILLLYVVLSERFIQGMTTGALRG